MPLGVLAAEVGNYGVPAIGPVDVMPLAESGVDGQAPSETTNAIVFLIVFAIVLDACSTLLYFDIVMSDLRTAMPQVPFPQGLQAFAQEQNKTLTNTQKL